MEKYVGSFEESIYWFSDNTRYSSIGWADAKSICEAERAHLVEINSEAEQLYLESALLTGNCQTFVILLSRQANIPCEWATKLIARHHDFFLKNAYPVFTSGVYSISTWWTNGNDITSNGVWIWPIEGSDFTTGSSDVYSNWASGEPSQNGCMYLLRQVFKWKVTDCIARKDFICECRSLQSVQQDPL